MLIDGLRCSTQPLGNFTPARLEVAAACRFSRHDSIAELMEANPDFDGNFHVLALTAMHVPPTVATLLHGTGQLPKQFTGIIRTGLRIVSRDFADEINCRLPRPRRRRVGVQ